MNWDHIFKWKLLEGSHDFPGPDGGTCINEAAIIAAGFKYKKVQSATDCPPCFSPVLSAYLLGINDLMPDGERQKLMRFVMRLSGSADTSVIEQERLELIVLRTTQRVVSSAMRAEKLEKQAKACEAVTSFADTGGVLSSAAREARDAWAARDARDAWDARAAWAAWAASAAREAWAASAARDARAARAAKAARDARDAWDARAAWAAREAWAASAARDARDALYADCIAIAEEAFAIGKQAEGFNVRQIEQRLERAKETA